MFIWSHVNFLPNKYGSPKEGDFRRNLSRFQEEACHSGYLISTLNLVY